MYLKNKLLFDLDFIKANLCESFKFCVNPLVKLYPEKSKLNECSRTKVPLPIPAVL